jgi:hypothetical protein
MQKEKIGNGVEIGIEKTPYPIPHQEDLGANVPYSPWSGEAKEA